MTISEYFSKMKGGAKLPPGVPISELVWSWIGAAIGIGLCVYLSRNYFEPRDLLLLIASFGASAVLVYGAIKVPFAQPRNLIGGHVLSAFVGVVCYQLFGDTVPAGAVAVATAIVVMLATRTVHPPAGATALIAVIGGPNVHSLGFLYPILPAGAGAVVLLLVALVVNNLSKNRKYPEYWF